MTTLDLCCYAWAFSSCGKWGLLLIVMLRLYIVVVSLIVEHRLSVHGLQ